MKLQNKIASTKFTLCTFVQGKVSTLLALRPSYKHITSSCVCIYNKHYN